MNAHRRKLLNEISAKLSIAESDLDSVQSEEQDYFDNMPESFQNGEKGEQAQAAIDALEEARSALTEAQEQINAIE